MTDGINLDGFTANRQPGASNNLDLNPTGQAPRAAFPAKDVSTQGAAGTTNKMSHTTEETRNFGAGN